MSDATRRTFLAAAGTSAAAAAAAVAAAPGASAAPGDASTSTHGSSASTGAPTGPRLVAYVEDPKSGRLTVMYGEDEVTVQDADLVRRLTRAAGR